MPYLSKEIYVATFQLP